MIPFFITLKEWTLDVCRTVFKKVFLSFFQVFVCFFVARKINFVVFNCKQTEKEEFILVVFANISFNQKGIVLCFKLNETNAREAFKCI